MGTERRYEVLEALGTGGFGTVYRARYQGEGGFSQMVALKVLNPEMAKIDEVASRLRDEARVLGLVRHRAIVQVHRLVQFDDSWTVVMELVEGADLGLVLKAGVIVPVGPMLEIMAEVAAALHVAWTTTGPDGRPLHLLHRDIKPSNIQVTSVGEVKVLDFGIARADFDEREAMTKKLAFGSTEYMAPERLDLMDGPASDVYSLGSVAYELLTRTQFGRTSATRERHEPRLKRNLARLREELAPWQEPVAELIADMLAWDPTQRPDARTVERRALSLRGQIEGEPLRFWAEDHIPKAMAVRTSVGGPSRTGSILIERREANTSAEPINDGEAARPEVDEPQAMVTLPAPPQVLSPPTEQDLPTEPAPLMPGQMTVTRRASDPTDAPSMAFMIGPQGKAPRLLNLLSLPDDEADEAATRRELRPDPEDHTQPVQPLAALAADELVEGLAGEPEPTHDSGEHTDPVPLPPPPTAAAPVPPVARPRPASSVLRAPRAPTPLAAGLPAASPAAASPATASPAAASPQAPVLPEAFATLPRPPSPGDSTDPILDLDPPTEEAPADPFTDEEPAPRRRRSPLPFIVAGLAAVGLLAWLLWPSPSGELQTTTPAERVEVELGTELLAEPAPPAGPAPAEPSPAAPETTEPSPEAPAPKTTEPSPGAPAPKATEPAPAPAATPAATPAPAAAASPAPAAKAHLTVSGDVSRVGLKGSGGTLQVSSGEVPPGTYEIWVRFDGRADQAAGKAGTITLAPGERVTLVCDQAFAECRRR